MRRVIWRAGWWGKAVARRNPAANGGGMQGGGLDMTGMAGPTMRYWMPVAGMSGAVLLSSPPGDRTQATKEDHRCGADSDIT